MHGDELQLQDFHHEGSHAEEEVQLGLHQDMLTWMRQTLMHVKHHTTLIRQNIETCMAGQVNGHHFKRSAKSLSRRQAALLAVTLPNPHLRNPRKPRHGMRRLARLVERRAKQSGAYIKCVR